MLKAPPLLSLLFVNGSYDIYWKLQSSIQLRKLLRPLSEQMKGMSGSRSVEDFNSSSWIRFCDVDNVLVGEQKSPLKVYDVFSAEISGYNLNT